MIVVMGHIGNPFACFDVGRVIDSADHSVNVLCNFPVGVDVEGVLNAWHPEQERGETEVETGTKRPPHEEHR